MAIGETIPSSISATPTFNQQLLQVWSCGGSAEAFMLANKRYKEITGIDIAYTGAFAAALGKSLLGNATTEVFAGRVLSLSKKLRETGKMTYFKPLMKNCIIKGSCVHRTMEELVVGKGDVSVVEKRLTRLPSFKGKSEILPIPPKYFPPPPLTFTIGVMKHAKDRALADHYVSFILSDEGQSFFDDAGFIPAISQEGQRLTETLEVKDV